MSETPKKEVLIAEILETLAQKIQQAEQEYQDLPDKRVKRGRELRAKIDQLNSERDEFLSQQQQPDFGITRENLVRVLRERIDQLNSERDEFIGQQQSETADTKQESETEIEQEIRKLVEQLDSEQLSVSKAFFVNMWKALNHIKRLVDKHELTQKEMDKYQKGFKAVQLIDATNTEWKEALKPHAEYIELAERLCAAIDQQNQLLLEQASDKPLARLENIRDTARYSKYRPPSKAYPFVLELLEQIRENPPVLQEEQSSLDALEALLQNAKKKGTDTDHLKVLEQRLENAKKKTAARQQSENSQPAQKASTIFDVHKPHETVRQTLDTIQQSDTAQKAKKAIQPAVSEYKKLSDQTGGYGGLYTKTMVIEFLCAIARFIVVFIILFPLFFVVEIVSFAQVASTTTFGNSGDAWSAVFFGFVTHLIVSLALGFFPVARSFFFILFPVFRTGASQRESDFLGAREPLPDELEVIITTVEDIRTNTNVRLPGVSHWRVIDNVFPESYTIGNTIYVSRGAIDKKFLSGLIAHELGHVKNKDGDLLFSLRQFIIPLVYFVGIDRQPLPAGGVSHTGRSVDSTQIVTDDSGLYYKVKALRIKFFLAFFFGGMGLLLLGRQWARFWRAKDLLADRFVKEVGQEDALIQVLEQYRHIDVAQPFLLTNRPYTAERLYHLKD